jgi:nucleotide-binding universal stress UspA family protein
VRELQDGLERQGGAKLDALARDHFAGKGVRHRVVLLVGTPWAEILDCALQEDAALLVIGTHSTTKAEHSLVGSTVRRVIDIARCRLLLVPPE